MKIIPTQKKFWSLLNKLKPNKAADNVHIKSISPKQWVNHFGTFLFNNGFDTEVILSLTTQIRFSMHQFQKMK